LGSLSSKWKHNDSSHRQSSTDVIVTRIGELGINDNCEGYSKPALLHLDSPWFESDYMCEVNLECE
jgi:hypothetical protein